MNEFLVGILSLLALLLGAWIGISSMMISTWDAGWGKWLKPFLK